MLTDPTEQAGARCYDAAVRNGVGRAPDRRALAYASGPRRAARSSAIASDLESGAVVSAPGSTSTLVIVRTCRSARIERRSTIGAVRRLVISLAIQAPRPTP